MSGIHKVIGEHSVSLILVRITFETIQGPVCPIYPRLFQIFDEIVPRDISLVVSELAEQVRMAEAAHEGLRVEHLLFEAVVRDQGPACDRPRETIKMTSVDEFILDTELQRILEDASKVELIVQSSN